MSKNVGGCVGNGPKWFNPRTPHWTLKSDFEFLILLRKMAQNMEYGLFLVKK